MLTIKVKVPIGRDRAAVVEFRSGNASPSTGIAAASASAALAASHGNAVCDPLRPWGHPPFGTYQLLAQGPAPAGSETEYGGQLLAFQPMSGIALEAESFGRLHLLAYAGHAGKEGRLRPTQGGIRFEQVTFNELLDQLGTDPQATLKLEELRPAAWWQFWKTAVSTEPLSPEAPRFSAPPLDEASLAAQIAGGKRFARRSRLQQEDDGDGSDSSSSQDSGHGVDSSGRILAGSTGAVLGSGSVASTQTNTNY